MNDTIFIRAIAKRNGFTLMLVGLGALVLSSLLLAAFYEYLFLVGIFLVSGSLVTILIGWFKVREPAYSFELSRQQIRYQHRFGSWQLGWEEIQRIDKPRMLQGVEHKELSMVGFRLKDYQPLLDSISPRLATNILMEQRPLLLQARRSECATGGCYSEDLLEDDRFKLADGRVIKGIKAMLANRMTKLRDMLGYDLFVYTSELDRNADEFVRLIRDCQEASRLSSQPPA